MNKRPTSGRGAPRQHGGIRSVKMQELSRDQEIARNRQAGGGFEWRRMDLHLHTPASSDYRDPGISYLDILKKAEEKGLDMIAFTDHNTVAGYAAMHREVETLTLLERLGRMADVERETLSEYRRLLAKITVLPGFEFTATFGFHVLGIFPENTSVRKLEYLLLNLNVPEEKMLIGAPDAGSTSDVLTSYQAITNAGGLAIAAHANSSNGVAMQGFPFGGQTKIAYTQDANLAALEVTDLDGQGRRNTASFYNGSKTEYPRRMHIIQGSDAHSLNTEQLDGMNKRLGVGARITEILVKEASFASLKELLLGNDFTRTRPFRPGMTWDTIDKARAEGQNMTQSFHERAFTHTSRARPILHDIVAFSNGEGGTIFVGANPDRAVPIHGIERPEEAIRMLKEDIKRTIEPPVEPDFLVQGGAERGVIVITVPRGDELPYAFTPTGQIFIRVEGESVVASRDELVALVLDAHSKGMAQVTQAAPAPTPAPAVAPSASAQQQRAAQPAVPVPAQPQTGSQPRRDERRDDRREQPQAGGQNQTGRNLPQENRNPRPQGQAQSQGQGQVQSQPTAQPPAPQDRTARPPVFANLPPEKIKGQVRPMAPSGTTASGEQAAPEGTPEVVQAAPALEDVPVVGEAQVEQRAEDPVETATEQVEASEPAAAVATARKGRSRRGQPAQPEVVQAAPEPEVEAIAEVTPEPVAEAVAEGKRPSRSSRGKKKAEDVDVEVAAESAMPTEATVSAEHLTREELVEAEPEAPAKGKGRTSRSRSKKTEIEAPTAAASETLAGEVAILVQAEVEPGAQIPGELPAAQAAEAELTSPAPTSRKRGRGKTVAQQTAEADAEAASEPDPAQAAPVEEAPAEEAPAEVEAPAKGRGSRARVRKSGEESGAASSAEPQPTDGASATPAPTATPAPPQTAAQTATRDLNSPISATVPTPPTTGVEIITSEERNSILYHTMRDLRNPSSVVHNVTRKSARRLWLYAIMQHEHGDPTAAEIAWHPSAPLGLWRREHRAGASRYDLAVRYTDGSLRIFYGVTDEGLVGKWRELIQLAENADYWGPPPIEK